MIVSLLLLTIISLHVRASMTSMDCSAHDNDSLFTKSTSIASLADEALVPSKFARVVSGVFVTCSNETTSSGTGGGTNPDGAYGCIIFKSSDVFPQGACDVPMNNGAPRCPNNQTVSYFMGPADVIAFVGCSPPPMRYFGFDAYIATRISEQYPFYPGQNFGDPISVSLNTSSGDLFNEPIVLLHSADAAAAAAVKDAYTSQAGVPPETISTRGIPASTVRLWDRSNGQPWMDSRPDYLTIVTRISIPLPGTEAEWKAYEESAWPIRFYFAYDEQKAMEPMNPPLKSRYSDSVLNEEEIYREVFTSLEENIRTNISATYGVSYLGTQYANFTEEGFYDDWDAVLARGDNASFVLPTRDALYGTPEVDDSETCFVCVTVLTRGVLIGMLHSKLLGAAYSSIGVSVQNFLSSRFLESHWFLDSDLAGSARRYFPTEPLVDDMFALDFLQPGECGKTGTPQWCVEFNQTTLLHKDIIYLLGERVYLLNETKIGPPGNTTIGSRLISFG